jgi:hypothetical protein
MLYLVSGMFRSGTSMMMRALEAGGLECVVSEAHDATLVRQTADTEYMLQHGESVYEPGRQAIAQANFPAMYDGKALKLLSLQRGRNAHFRPLPGGVKVVVMHRDPEEIRQSYEAAFAKVRARNTAPWLKEGGAYEQHMDLVCAGFANRRDCEGVTELDYRDVLADPLMAFLALKGDGWPIDVQAAASVVDPALCRFKREELEVGI